MTPLYLVSFFFSMVRFLETKKFEIFVLRSCFKFSLVSCETDRSIVLWCDTWCASAFDQTKHNYFNPAIYFLVSWCIFDTSLFYFYIFCDDRERTRILYWAIGMVYQFGKPGSQNALWPTREDILYSRPLLWMLCVLLIVVIYLWKKNRWSLPSRSIYRCVSHGRVSAIWISSASSSVCFLSLGVVLGYDHFWRRFRNRACGLYCAYRIICYPDAGISS